MMTWCDLVCRQFDRQVSSDYALQQDASVQTVAAPRESAAFFTRSQRRSHEAPLQAEETRPKQLPHSTTRICKASTIFCSEEMAPTITTVSPDCTSFLLLSVSKAADKVLLGST